MIRLFCGWRRGVETGPANLWSKRPEHPKLRQECRLRRRSNLQAHAAPDGAWGEVGRRFYKYGAPNGAFAAGRICEVFGPGRPVRAFKPGRHRSPPRRARMRMSFSPWTVDCGVSLSVGSSGHRMSACVSREEGEGQKEVRPHPGPLPQERGRRSRRLWKTTRPGVRAPSGRKGSNATDATEAIELSNISGSGGEHISVYQRRLAVSVKAFIRPPPGSPISIRPFHRESVGQMACFTQRTHARRSPPRP